MCSHGGICFCSLQFSSLNAYCFCFFVWGSPFSSHSMSLVTQGMEATSNMYNSHFNHRSLSALSAYHTGLIAPMKIRTEAPGNLRLYSGSPTRSEKEQVSISSFYYKERVSVRAIVLASNPFWILVSCPPCAMHSS